MKKHDYKVTVDGSALTRSDNGVIAKAYSKGWPCVDTAAELARRWNAEPELRAALEMILQAADLNGNTYIQSIARAALASARGEPVESTAAPSLLSALEMVHAIVKNSPRLKAELFNADGWNLITAALAAAKGES